MYLAPKTIGNACPEDNQLTEVADYSVLPGPNGTYTHPGTTQIQCLFQRHSALDSKFGLSQLTDKWQRITTMVLSWTIQQTFWWCTLVWNVEVQRNLGRTAPGAPTANVAHRRESICHMMVLLEFSLSYLQLCRVGLRTICAVRECSFWRRKYLVSYWGAATWIVYAFHYWSSECGKEFRMGPVVRVRWGVFDQGKAEELGKSLLRTCKFPRERTLLRWESSWETESYEISMVSDVFGF